MKLLVHGGPVINQMVTVLLPWCNLSLVDCQSSASIIPIVQSCFQQQIGSCCSTQQQYQVGCCFCKTFLNHDAFCRLCTILPSSLHRVYHTIITLRHSHCTIRVTPYTSQDSVQCKVTGGTGTQVCKRQWTALMFYAAAGACYE